MAREAAAPPVTAGGSPLSNADWLISMTSLPAGSSEESLHPFGFAVGQLTEGNAEVRASPIAPVPADAARNVEADSRCVQLGFEQERSTKGRAWCDQRRLLGQYALHPALAQVDEPGGNC